MGCLVYNPQKGRLETLDVEFTDNTTWFTSRGNDSVTMIADWNGGLRATHQVRLQLPGLHVRHVQS